MSLYEEHKREQFAQKKAARQPAQSGEKVPQETKKEELIQAVAENLAASAGAESWRGSAELEEDVIVARAREFRAMESQSAAKAEERAQGALAAESRGDPAVASVLWEDSRRSDREAKKYGREAARYERMGAQRTMAVTERTITRNDTSAGQTPGGTYADREALELQIANLRSEMQAYTRASGGQGDPQALIWYANQIHDAMTAMEALPKEPVREDILLQTLGGNYYQGETSLAGAGGQMALGLLGLDAPADIRDISYDIQNWQSVPGWQKAADLAAVLPLVGGLKYVDEVADGVKAAARAADAAGTAGKNADELVDAAGELVYNGAKLSNQEVREWYVSHVAGISDTIDNNLPLEEQARLAFESRNSLRTQAREMMMDVDARAMLDEKRPNRTFEELLRDKMERKGMTEEEALLDIYQTATKTNETVNKLFGLGG